MKQMLNISIYALTLPSILFSQSLTGNYQVDYINVDYTWVIRPPDASTDLAPILLLLGNKLNYFDEAAVFGLNILNNLVSGS